MPLKNMSYFVGPVTQIEDLMGQYAVYNGIKGMCPIKVWFSCRKCETGT